MAMEKAHRLAAGSDACLAMETVISPGRTPLLADVGLEVESSVGMEPHVLLLLEEDVASIDSMRVTASAGSPFSHLRLFRRSRNFCESPMASWMAIHCSLSIFPVVSALGGGRSGPEGRLLRAAIAVEVREQKGERIH